jgi:hypothetical protein
MPLTGVTGLFGNQAFLFPAADLAVVVSEHLPEDAAKLLTAEGQSAAREHARVISGCFAKSTVLPFRFGTTFGDDEALRRSVRSNQRHFMANVERLRGMAEEITCKRMESGKMLLDIAHLVEKKTVERYQNKYSTVTLELKDCAMQLSGPWPPYHFVHREQRGHA